MLLTYAIMLDFLTLVYMQFVIMLLQLKVLNHEIKCLFVKRDYPSRIKINHMKYHECESYIFIAFEINTLYRMYVYCIEVCVYVCIYIYIYPLYSRYML